MSRHLFNSVEQGKILSTIEKRTLLILNVCCWKLLMSYIFFYFWTLKHFYNIKKLNEHSIGKSKSVFKNNLKHYILETNKILFICTRRYGMLLGPTSSSCRGLWPSVQGFFCPSKNPKNPKIKTQESINLPPPPPKKKKKKKNFFL